MSAALERVIAEQQATIDHCLAMHESNAKAWDRQNKMTEDAFELLARAMHLDYNDKEKHRDMKYAIRQFFLDHHFCMNCERFICECEYDE